MWTFTHEIGRKAIHLSILIVLFAYYYIWQSVGKQVALLVLVFLLIIFLILEFLRLELEISIPWFEPFIRPKEQNRPYGVIYFLSGIIISLAVFDFKIALAAILMITFGDMGAALIGKRYGKTIIFKNKTLSGTLTELTLNLIVGFIILSNIYIILAMAFVATVVETYVEELDDNLLVPLFAGGVGQLLLMII